MVLELRELKKSYGTVRALKGISYTFRQGIYGILGANGAGKSTLLHLITDNVARDAAGGGIYYEGQDILKLGKDFLGRVGYMPQQQGFYEDFTPMAFLRYMASLKGLRGRDARKQIGELLEIVNLTDSANRKIGGFSGGMKQRVLLAQALLGNPEILILDEPTAGLDPKERIGIRNYVAEMSKNKIILLATHIVNDVACIADRVLLLKEGEIAAEGSPKELTASMAGKVGEIVCRPEEVHRLQKEYKVGSIRQREKGTILRLAGDKLPEGATLVREGFDLEDVYLYYFEQENNTVRL